MTLMHMQKTARTHIIAYYKYVVICVLIAILAFIVGGIVLTTSADEEASRERAKYPFLASRLFGPLHDDMIINFTMLREVMNKRYGEQKVPVGVYFEYLPTGASIGVNDQLQVEIGSLSKVPAVMGIYKQLEEGSMTPNTQLTIGKNDVDNRFGDLWEKGEGAVVSVHDAINYTLKKSDNTAANTLTSALPQGELQAVFDELDLPRTRTGPFPVMSPKSYASVFRSLFLSAYLTNNSSNEILEKLTQTEFSDKLPSGVPSDVPVAHKIGVFRIKDTQDIYSDCGIVYEPNRPYILCVMAAADENTARTEINAYSKMVYSYIARAKPSRQSGK